MVILGSTGSIGKNSIFIANKFGIKIEALGCASNYQLLNEQISQLNPKFVYIKDKKLKDKVNHKNVFCENEIHEMIDKCESDLVINALVGFSGLLPSLTIQKCGKTLALANKESLVVGGKFLDVKNIRAIDSEHFGLKFLLENKTPVSSLTITASGGAFYKTPIKDLKNVTQQMALKHPNWDMGAKITIDSATMMNKIFEILEAFWLYNIKNIDALIERTSNIHALVSFIDGSTTAHISGTDMKLAIAHAIYPNLKERILNPVSLTDMKKIEFKKINLKKYPIFSLKNEVLNNPDIGVIINATNDVAIKAFLDKKCGFCDISKSIFKSINKFGNIKINSVNDIIETNNEINAFTTKELKI